MQLAWQTDNESKLDVKAAMMGLREVQCSPQLVLRFCWHVLGCMTERYVQCAQLSKA